MPRPDAKRAVTARILSLAFLWLALAASASCPEDNVSVRAYIDRANITIGDRIRYTIEATAPRATEVQMPVFKGGMIGDFEIKDSSTKTAERIFGRKTVRSLFYITAYSVGKKEIPQAEIKYKPGGAKDWAAEKTKALQVTIRSVLPKEMPPDIKDVRAPAYFFEINWFLVGGIILLLAIFATALAAYIKARNRAPVRLPHETALEELEAIRAQFLRGGDIKEYYVGVSDCVRRYIERAFRLKAPEMTTEEFLDSLRDSSSLTVPQKDLLKGFLNACDLVKFARYRPTGAEAENVYTTAKSFVEETKEAG
ncbi:MAG: hypothetical protein JXB40_02660 [Candidatus Omnitrophica bacterium]|nr:hypothetical protein [Candidatus Omnitrophota bacterium]